MLADRPQAKMARFEDRWRRENGTIESVSTVAPGDVHAQDYIGRRESRSQTAIGRAQPIRQAVEAEAARLSLLGCPLSPMARLAIRPDPRSAENRHSMAS